MTVKIITPYVYEQEISQHKDMFWELDVHYEQDEAGIGSDLMYQKMWNKYPEDDIFILHADMTPHHDNWFVEVLDYVKKYPVVGSLDKFNIVENYRIQHYKKNSGYGEWHCERTGHRTKNRTLVFMTYLNTVKDGGTIFKYQNMTMPCIKGLTLIWPTDFTHLHRGQISKLQEKYIITGWYNFI